MTEPMESTFERNATELFAELERSLTALQDAGQLATEIAKRIDDAKSLLRAGRTAEAEQKYSEAKTLVDQAEVSNRAEGLAWKLLWVELGYLSLLLLLGYLTHNWRDYWLWAKFVNLHSGTAWFGALGGVAIGLYGIYSHIQARDFDPKYTLWYVCKPITGAIFGWFVFLVYFAGLIAVQGTTGGIRDVKAPLVPYAIAFLAGFSERFTIRIIDRLMQVLTTWQEEATSTPAKPAKF